MSEWYKNGLRFSCTQCGNCCTGPPGAVWFNDAEGKAMAKKKGVSEDVFYKRFARKVGNKWSLREQEIDGDFDCVFLDRTSTLPSCSLYEARPSQCRSWPFWPEILKSRESWAQTKCSTPCPGMDEGELIPVEAIRIQRDST